MNSENQMDERELIATFNETINHLSEENNLQLLEQITGNFNTLFLTVYSPDKFIYYQAQLNDLFGPKYAQIILNFLKNSIHIDYKGQHKQTYRRLLNLKKVTSLNLLNAERAFAIPEALRSIFFTINAQRPLEIKLVLSNNDSSTFQTSMDYNTGLNLLNTIATALTDKLKQGHNDLDLNFINEFKERTHKLNQALDEIIENAQSSNEE